MSDVNWLNSVYTYVSDDGSKQSWIDHIVCSSAVDNLVSGVTVLDDVYLSDHKPLSCTVECSIVVTIGDVQESAAVGNGCIEQVPKWSSCNVFIYANYQSYLDELMRNVDIPVYVFDNVYDNVTHRNTLIDNFSGILQSVLQVMCLL